VRTPIMVSWPAKLQPEDSADFAHAIDFLPTIVKAAGLTVPEGQPGIDLTDAKVRGERKRVFGVTDATHNMTVGSPSDTIHYLWCVEGDWKLMIKYPANDTTHYKKLHLWDKKSLRLYNVSKDPHEKTEIAAEHPEVVERLKAAIESWHDMKG